MRTDNESGFPILYGRRIRNTGEFIEVQTAAMIDLLAGRISVKEANAINLEAGAILKKFQAVLSLRQLDHRVPKQNLVR
jgi:hypothetical protein